MLTRIVLTTPGEAKNTRFRTFIPLLRYPERDFFSPGVRFVKFVGLRLRPAGCLTGRRSLSLSRNSSLEAFGNLLGGLRHPEFHCILASGYEANAEQVVLAAGCHSRLTSPDLEEEGD